MSVLDSVGEQVRLYTYLYLKEDVLALYGFATTDDVKTAAYEAERWPARRMCLSRERWRETG